MVMKIQSHLSTGIPRILSSYSLTSSTKGYPTESSNILGSYLHVMFMLFKQH